MPDPWLTTDGKLHPAAEVLGSWTEGEHTSACVQYGTAGNGWWIQHYREYASGESATWYTSITSRVAHALLEKDAREKLWRRGIEVLPTFFEVDRTTLIVHDFLNDKYLTEFGNWSDQINAAAEFDAYPAAIQAAILAAEQGEKP